MLVHSDDDGVLSFKSVMKRLLFFVFSLWLLMPVMEAHGKSLPKQLEKEYNKRLKEYRKGNWKIPDDINNFEEALLKHFERIVSLGKDNYEILVVSTVLNSEAVDHNYTLSIACANYSRQASNILQEDLMPQMSVNGMDPLAGLEQFYARYQQILEKEIKEEMVESYSIFRCLNPDSDEEKEYEMQTVFILNDGEGSKIRLKALEQALQESESLEPYSNEIIELFKNSSLR